MNPELKRQRFLHLLEDAQLKPATLAKRVSTANNINFSPSIFYNFLNGRSDTFEPETIELIAPFLNVQPENFWRDKFILKSVESGNQKSSTFTHKAQLPQGGDRHFPLNVDDLIPMYGAVSASSPEIVHFTEDYMIEEVPRHPSVQKVKGAFAMQVAGDSMAPRHLHGERVYINPHQVPHIGQDCIIVQEDGNAILKQFRGETLTEWKFSQLNPAKELTFDKSVVRKIFAVVR